MFTAFYLWHGWVLNDLNRLSFPVELFLIVASIVYLTIGFVVSKLYDARFIEKYNKRLFLKGFIIGALSGLFVFMITIVTGVSFSKVMSVEYILLDVSWQIIEQSIGGIAIAVIHFYVPAADELIHFE